MSYIRFTEQDSDVYVFYGANGYECCGCKLTGTAVFEDPEDMQAHLLLHREAGHIVPDVAFRRLEQDRLEQE